MPADTPMVLVPGKWTGSVEEYLAHYGSGCRDCADEAGFCPASGMTCDFDQRMAAFRHALRAINYGIKHGYLALSASPARGEGDAPFTVDELAQEIRRVDGNHSLGAGALAEALMPFLSRPSPGEGDAPVACPTCNGTGFQRVDDLSERSCVGCGGSGLAKDRDAKRAWISAAVSRPSPSPGDGDAPASIVIDDATRDAALRSGKKLNDWITGALHKAAEMHTHPTPATPEGLRIAVGALERISRMEGWTERDGGQSLSDAVSAAEQALSALQPQAGEGE